MIRHKYIADGSSYAQLYMHVSVISSAAGGWQCSPNPWSESRSPECTLCLPEPFSPCTPASQTVSTRASGCKTCSF